ncbi:MAG: two-component regulator propeller domain-containing protein [Prolixibacteraceae bacterium]
MIGYLRKIIIVLLAIFCAHSTYGSDLTLEFREISPPGGFTFGSINQIIEDSHGFIWFSSQHGLFKYNTASIEKYIHIPNDPTSISSNAINCMSKDPSGTLWFATNNGICFYNEEKEIFNTPVWTNTKGDTIQGIINQIICPADSQILFLSGNYLFRLKPGSSTVDTVSINPKDNRPTFIYTDEANRIWLKSTEGVVYWADLPYNVFHHFGSIVNNRVLTMLFTQNKLWIGYEWEGADCYNINGDLIAHYGENVDEAHNIGSNRVRKIVTDDSSNIWLATYNGIALLNDKSIQHFNSKNTPGISHSSIYDIFTDSKGGTWVSTWSGKLAYSNPFDKLFTHLSSDIGLSDNVISSFVEVGTNLWIGTEGGGLNYYNTQQQTIKSFNIDNNRNLNVKSLAVDNHGSFWVGTFNNGLWRLSQFNKEGLPDKRERVIDGGFYSLAIVGNTLYAGSYFLGLYSINTQTLSIENLRWNSNDPNSLSSNQVRSLFVDHNKILWVGTQTGLNRKQLGESTFERFISHPSDSNSLSSNLIYSIYEDADYTIWVGTSSGLNKLNPNNNSFTCYTPANGLSGYEIYGITQDKQNNLWLSTDNGITQFNPNNFECRNFYASDGLQGNMFNPGSVFKTKEDKLYFGGPNGASEISPRQIKMNPQQPDVVVTGIHINNQEVKPWNPNSILAKSIVTLKELELKYNQNSISFEFVATNFLNPGKNQFKYRLLNYDNQWVNAGKQRTATFTKIPPGGYVFQVLAANNDGIWNTVPKEILIRINSPWWQRWYAYSFYLIVVILLVFFIQREIFIRQRLKHEVLIEKVKSTSEKELTQNKLQFFTNISHEIKTPLSLILYPLDVLIKNRENDKELIEYLKIIQRNGKRLRNIIHQVIDIRRIDAQKLSFKPVETNAVPILNEITDCFSLEARDKNITFKTQFNYEKLTISVDPDKFDNIVFNLLNNAFKFVPSDGEVSISAEIQSGEQTILIGPQIEGNYLEISIFNAGSFIPEHEFTSIFERFTQSKSNSREGTGIGLNMVMEYLKLHNGNLNVESNEAFGTTFIVRFPVSVDQQMPLKPIDTAPLTIADAPLEVYNSHNSVGSKKKLILVVEDNAELRIFLKKSLVKHFSVITASNGENGLQAAFEFNPDLIVSDVMMPVMDGFEMCAAIKEDENTSHIPVLLLTALSEDESKIKGYQKGADAYISKPFNEYLLLTQITNLIQSRQKLKEAFLSPNSNLTEFDTGDAEFSFIEKASRLVESNLLDANFSVETLAEKLRISRTSLHRKIKAHTDQSTSEFIRFVRLKKALTMLRSGEKSIDEIGYAVGFNSASYFSSCFKKQFGKSPKEFLP